jgi:hypothetical protein
MTYLLERARDLKKPVTLTVHTYPESGAEVVTLSIHVPDGSLTWRSEISRPGGVERVVAMARMMGVEVFAC